MAKKRLPKGQINNKKVLNKLNALMKDLGKDISIRVGIIGSIGSKQHPDTELTMAELGAIHEFGANISTTDKMKGYFWHRWGIHKSNNDVVIPARSFLRMPILGKDGKKELTKAVKDNISADDDINKYLSEHDSKFMLDVANIVGLTALKRVQEAFETGGFGQWKPISTFTLSNRKGAADNPPLNDTGDLRESITYEVKERK